MSGTDWRGRCRQAALDRAFMNSGRVSDAIFDMLERLEGKPRVAAATTTEDPAGWPADLTT